MAEKLSMKEAWVEADLLAQLSKPDKKIMQQIEIPKRKEMIALHKSGQDWQHIFNEQKEVVLANEVQKEVELNDPSNKIDDKQRKNMQAFLRGLGIYNPSLTTLNATLNSGVTPNLSLFTNTVGMFTKMDLQTQMAHDYYINSVGLDYIKIAQTDEVIKQNDKLIEQNDRIIQLLEQSITK